MSCSRICFPRSRIWRRPKGRIDSGHLVDFTSVSAAFRSSLSIHHICSFCLATSHKWRQPECPKRSAIVDDLMPRASHRVWWSCEGGKNADRQGHVFFQGVLYTGSQAYHLGSSSIRAFRIQDPVTSTFSNQHCSLYPVGTAGACRERLADQSHLQWLRRGNQRCLRCVFQTVKLLVILVCGDVSCNRY